MGVSITRSAALTSSSTCACLCRFGLMHRTKCDDVDARSWMSVASSPMKRRPIELNVADFLAFCDVAAPPPSACVAVLRVLRSAREPILALLEPEELAEERQLAAARAPADADIAAALA